MKKYLLELENLDYFVDVYYIRRRERRTRARMQMSQRGGRSICNKFVLVMFFGQVCFTVVAAVKSRVYETPRRNRFFRQCPVICRTRARAVAHFAACGRGIIMSSRDNAY